MQISTWKHQGIIHAMLRQRPNVAWMTHCQNFATMNLGERHSGKQPITCMLCVGSRIDEDADG